MRKLSLATLILAGGVFSSAMAALQITPQTVSAAPIPCDGRAYMLRTEQSGGNDYSQLYEFQDAGTSIDLSTIHNSPTGLTEGGTPVSSYANGFIINALAYNPADGYMYAAKNDPSGAMAATNDIVRFNADGSLDMVYTVNFSSPSNLKGAAFGLDGTYYALGTGPGMQDQLYIITGLAAAPGVGPATTVQTITMPINMGDLAFDHTSGNLYAISNVTNDLYLIDPTTGNVTTISNGTPHGPGVSLGTNAVGSLYFTATGELMGYVNQDATATNGQLVKISETDGHMTLVKNGPVTNNSDATACVPVNYSLDTVKSAGSVTSTSNTQFTVPYTVQVINHGTLADPNVQLVDNLSQTFTAGNPTITVSGLTVQNGPCTANNSFNGVTVRTLLSGTNTLNSGQSCSLTFNVALQYAAASDVPTNTQLNTVYASSSATGSNAGHIFNSDGTVDEPFNVLAVDTSTDSSSLPATSHSDSPVPTPVVLSVAMIDVVKSAGAATSVSETKYTVPYQIIVGNKSSTATPNVQVVDNLTLTFAQGAPAVAVSDVALKSGPCTLNTGYNGVADIRLLSGTNTLQPGESCTITFVVTLGYNASSDVPTSTQNNTALASSVTTGPNGGHTYSGSTPTAPSGLSSEDTSTDGPALPTSAHGDTATPTPVAFRLAETGFDTNILISYLVIIGALMAGVAAKLTGRFSTDSFSR